MHTDLNVLKTSQQSREETEIKFAGKKENQQSNSTNLADSNNDFQGTWHMKRKNLSIQFKEGFQRQSIINNNSIDKDILNIFPCCRVICATISTPTLIAQTGHTCKEKQP